MKPHHTLLAAAAYGFSIGIFHSPHQALYNLAKFPLLILCVGAVCAIGYAVCARFAARLRVRDTAALVTRLYADVALLLVSLASVNLLLAVVLERPTSLYHLADYPLFQGLNVAFIALCGGIAVVRQATALLGTHGLSPRGTATIIGLWLSLSLFVGGQAAWYLRPFFGLAWIAVDDVPLFLGASADLQGASSFFEAVLNLIRAP